MEVFTEDMGMYIEIYDTSLSSLLTIISQVGVYKPNPLAISMAVVSYQPGSSYKQDSSYQPSSSYKQESSYQPGSSYKQGSISS